MVKVIDLIAYLQLAVALYIYRVGKSYQIESTNISQNMPKISSKPHLSSKNLEFLNSKIRNLRFLGFGFLNDHNFLMWSKIG